jgi:nucleoid-associated protein YgaU
MTRETRIGLLVGLAFIIMFGLVLSELMGSKAPPATRVPPEEVGLPIGASPPPEPPAAAPIQAVRAIDADRHLAVVDPAPLRAPGASGGGAIPLAAVEQIPLDQQPVMSGGIDLTPLQPPVAEPASPVRMPTYKVQPGDTLIRIARKFYGPDRVDQYVRIRQANNLSNDLALTVGKELVIPPPAATVSAPVQGSMRPDTARPPGGGSYREMDLNELQRHLASLSARPAQPARASTYVVRAGENLATIAGKVLGDASRAGAMKIFNANRNKMRGIDDLRVGMELRIPR